MAFLGVVLFSLASALGSPLAQSAAPAAGVGGTPLEYEVKAAFIFNFVNFVEWPASALGAPASPFRICLAGPDPFKGALDDTIKGENIQGHPLVVERLEQFDEAVRCQVLYVPDTDTGVMARALRPVASLPVLTIGESDAFLRGGGVVSFVVDQGHVRFDVNRRSAQERGLNLSSRLLRVARNVR